MASKRARQWCIALISVLALYTAYRCTLLLVLKAKLNAIRKQGYPVTLAELNKSYPPIPAGENAAEVYRIAFAKNVKLGDLELSLPVVGWASLPPRREPLSQSIHDGISLYLKTNQESLALLHAATAMAHCRFTMNLDISAPSMGYNINLLRYAIQKLSLEAIYNADLGDGRSTAPALVAAIGLVRQFSEEPLSIPRLIQQVDFDLARQALERSLTQVQFNPNQLGSILTALAATEDSLSIHNILVGERAWCDDEFSQIRRGKESPERALAMNFQGDSARPAWYWHPVAFIYRFGGIEEIDQLRYLRLSEQTILTAGEPFPKRIVSLQSLAQQTEQPSRVLPLSQINSSLNCQLLKMDTKFIAQLRVTRAGLSVESYRSEHDDLPDSIPLVLDDPFDGQPLRYKKLAKGYVVYSVGEDGKDDGGDEKKDITFTVER